jgi:formylglycine-generating enzyme required for sulfatase activity
MQVFVTLEDEPDPRVVTDPSARARISATGLPWRIRHQVTGIELLLVPPGEFSLGSPEGEVGRKAQWEIQRKCSITQPFYLAATEVSQRQWLQIMPTNPSWFDEFQVAGLADQLELPVDQVTWVECNDFCDEAGGVFRLPSEAEWEYACRAGTTTAFSFGDSITIGQVNFDSQKPFAGGAPAQGRGTTVRCGSLPGNQWGFHEMHGNVMEWCADAWQDQPDRTTEAPTTHPNPKQARPCRGGGWYSAGAFCRSATRNMNSPRGADSICGFRVAMSVR